MSAPTIAAAPVVVGLDQIQAAVTLPAAVTAVEGAFRALARGHVTQPPPMGLELPAGQVHVKSAQLGHGQPVVVKVATGFPGNTDRGLASGDGLMLALDPGTGGVTAVLLDRGWLTDVRTAAATAVAVRYLASAPLRRLALLGTGVQARLTLRTLDAVGLLPGDVAVWGRAASSTEHLVGHPDLNRLRLTVASSARAAVHDADLVITVTAAREPVLRGDWLTDRALVIAVGADSPGKRECDDTVLRRARRVIVDDREQSTHVGELQHHTASRAAPPHVLELGAVLLDPDAADSAGIRLCDLTGLGAHDAAIAALALSSALDSSGGTSPQRA